MSHLKVIFTCLILFNNILAYASLKQNANTIYTVDLLVAYPSQLENHSVMEQRVRTIINETNSIYRNSGVNLQLNLIHITAEPISLAQSEEVSGVFLNCTDMENFENSFPFNYWYRGSTNGSLIRNIINKRRQYKADIVLYIDYRNTGISSGNTVGGLHSAYTKIAYSELGTRIFAHEIGHVYGLRHEDGAIVPFDQTRPGFRTIMAVNCAHNSGNLGLKNEISLFSGSKSYQSGHQLYQSCNWDAVSILNEIAKDISQWGERIANGEKYNPNTVPVKITEVSLVNECISWGLDEKGKLWLWDRYHWSDIESSINFKQISAINESELYMVSNDNKLYKYTATNNKFKLISTPENIQKVATAYDGKLWILGASNLIYEYKSDKGKWKNRKDNTDIYFKDISIERGNNAWAIRNDGKVCKWSDSNKKWKEKTEIKAKKISAGYDRTIVLTDLSDNIFIKYQGEEFKPISNAVPSMCDCDSNDTKFCDNKINQGKADDIFVLNQDRIWAYAQGYLYTYVRKNGFLMVYEYGQNNKLNELIRD